MAAIISPITLSAVSDPAFASSIVDFIAAVPDG
jgi:hypothetical protein